MTILIVVAWVTVYIGAGAFTARVIANEMYKADRRSNAKYTFTDYPPEWDFIAVMAALAGIFWPFVLPVLALASVLTAVAKRWRLWFVPTLAAEERAARLSQERKERAEALRASAVLLDDPDLREMLKAAARDLEDSA